MQLERAAATGGLHERLALDAEILRQRGAVDHPGPPTKFASLALYLEAPFFPAYPLVCTCEHQCADHRGAFGGSSPGPECLLCSCVEFVHGPQRKKPDPRADPAFRDMLFEAGELEALRYWIVRDAWDAQNKFRRATTWGDRCRVVAYSVSEYTKHWPEKERRRAFRDAYPFGQRAFHPYRAWLSEVRRATGKKSPKPVWGADTKTGNLFT